MSFNNRVDNLFFFQFLNQFIELGGKNRNRLRKLHKLNYSLDTKTGALVRFEGNGEDINAQHINQFTEELKSIPNKQEQELMQLEMQIKRLELIKTQKLLFR